MLVHQVTRKPVDARRHGRVRREHHVLGRLAQRLVKRQPVFVHPLANDLQRRECAVPLIQMVHAGRDPQRRNARTPPMPNTSS